MSGDSGHEAGPMKAWREGVFDGQESQRAARGVPTFRPSRRRWHFSTEPSFGFHRPSTCRFCNEIKRRVRPEHIEQQEFIVCLDQPSQAQAIELEDAIEMNEQRLHLLAITPGLLVPRCRDQLAKPRCVSPRVRCRGSCVLACWGSTAVSLDIRCSRRACLACHLVDPLSRCAPIVQLRSA